MIGGTVHLGVLAFQPTKSDSTAFVPERAGEPVHSHSHQRHFSPTIIAQDLQSSPPAFLLHLPPPSLHSPPLLTIPPSPTPGGIMKFSTLTTLLLGAVLHVAAQTSDPAKVAAIIAQLEDTPALAAQFNSFSGREVRIW